MEGVSLATQPALAPAAAVAAPHYAVGLHSAGCALLRSHDVQYEPTTARRGCRLSGFRTLRQNLRTTPHYCGRCQVRRQPPNRVADVWCWPGLELELALELEPTTHLQHAAQIQQTCDGLR